MGSLNTLENIFEVPHDQNPPDMLLIVDSLRINRPDNDIIIALIKKPFTRDGQSLAIGNLLMQPGVTVVFPITEGQLHPALQAIYTSHLEGCLLQVPFVPVCLYAVRQLPPEGDSPIVEITYTTAEPLYRWGCELPTLPCAVKIVNEIWRHTFPQGSNPLAPIQALLQPGTVTTMQDACQRGLNTQLGQLLPGQGCYRSALTIIDTRYALVLHTSPKLMINKNI